MKDALMNRFSVGDQVIYRKPKTSAHPGPRARNVRASEHGEDYSYAVDKYWTVSAVLDDATIEITTRTGKKHTLRTDDPNLREAGLARRMVHRERFRPK